jgi:hypothetical protein
LARFRDHDDHHCKDVFLPNHRGQTRGSAARRRPFRYLLGFVSKPPAEKGTGTFCSPTIAAMVPVAK